MLDSNKTRRRRPIVLLELLISMGLLALLMTALFGYYRYVTFVEMDTEKTRAIAFNKRLVQARLNQTLGRATKDGLLFTEEISGRYITGTSLVFTYENGVVIDPAFSGTVLGRLYLDPTGSVCLATWTYEKNRELGAAAPPMQLETLMEGVSKLEFQFYTPYDDNNIIDRVLTSRPRPEKEADKTSSSATQPPVTFVTVIADLANDDITAPVRTVQCTIPIISSKALIRYPSL